MKGCFIKCQHFHHVLQICGSALLTSKWAVRGPRAQMSLTALLFLMFTSPISWFTSHIQTHFMRNLWILKVSQCLSCYFSFPSLQYFLWIGSVSGSYESLWISTCINEHDEKGKIHPSLIITSHITSVGLSLCFLKESTDDGSYSVKTHKSAFIHDVWSSDQI